MKSYFLLATLAVSVIFAYPADNTPIRDVPQEELKDCNVAVLQWNITTHATIYQYNTFNFQVEYVDSSRDYDKTMVVERMSDSKLETTCYEDGVWCVTHDGWKTSDEVTIHYANQKFVHKTPEWRRSANGAQRDDFFYWNCVKW
ncbi:MAG: hypothetical protein J3R72DRAFT_424450 [Linnemannia gamsii]|nr:MAG: hypothetical protein J3R72DRAFT_424450 [Linnemannia gamsii]